MLYRLVSKKKGLPRPGLQPIASSIIDPVFMLRPYAHKQTRVPQLNTWQPCPARPVINCRATPDTSPISALCLCLLLVWLPTARETLARDASAQHTASTLQGMRLPQQTGATRHQDSGKCAQLRSGRPAIVFKGEIHRPHGAWCRHPSAACMAAPQCRAVPCRAMLRTHGYSGTQQTLLQTAHAP